MTNLETKLLEALKENHLWHIMYDDVDGYSGSELEKINISAISYAESQQAEPVRLTDEEIVLTIRQASGYVTNNLVMMARSIEDTVLQKQGYKVEN